MFLLLVLAVFVAACSYTAQQMTQPSGVQATQTNTQQTPLKAIASVSIENFAFVPNEVTIPVHGRVDWTNNQNVQHSIIIEGLADGPVMQTEDVFMFNFSTPGTYSYHCGIHPSMKGTVIVK